MSFTLAGFLESRLCLSVFAWEVWKRLVCGCLLVYVVGVLAFNVYVYKVVCLLNVCESVVVVGVLVRVDPCELVCL